ncbi:MAG: hypothetical protein JXA69_00280 [Phycisphaerae bacterium]|nr:hypothetical protein [Phycisphaerae bacterium]
MRMRGISVLVAVVSLFSVGGVAGGADGKAGSLGVPFSEMFAAPTLGAAWGVHVAEGNAVAVKDGTLEIRGVANTQACIERGLHTDGIRVSCAMRPSGKGASAALMLSWDRQNWCRVGVGGADTSRIQAREVLGTYAYDYDLGLWPTGEWYRVAIELGTDCIRFLGGRDGEELATLRISRRPERFAAAPARLLIGDGPVGRRFPPASPFIDPPPSDTLATVLVRSVEVVRLDAGCIEASPEERAVLQVDERDVLGEQELASSDDPTFESVSRHYPAMQWPREAIGVKDHPFAIGVAHDGALQFTEDSARFNEPIAFFEIGEPVYRFGTGPLACRRKLHNGYMPIVVLNDSYDGLELEQTAFGYAKEFSPEEPLFGIVRLKITNAGDAVRSVKLRLRIQPAGETLKMPSWQFDIPAGTSHVVALKAPYAILDEPVVELSSDACDAMFAEVAAYWDRLLGPGSRFEVPEPRVQDAYRAWLVYNFLNVHKRGDVYHVCDGSGFYTRVYGYSAALYCNGMDLLGYHDLAEQYFDSLLTFMQSDGLLAVNFGDTDTGAALCMMSEHYRITRDADWLRRVTPKMTAMCNWIIGRRKQVLASAATQPAVTKGLIRYRPYADLLHPAADYFSNGYLCSGLAATASVFAEVGMHDEAARLEAESRTYRSDIMASMQAVAFTDGGMTVLPAIPDTRELWKESNGSANGYYSIITPCMLEAGVPAWNEPQADLIIGALRNRGGLTLGLPRFHDLVDHAYAYGYWMTCLRRDEVKPAILGLYASMAYGMTRDTYAAVECTAIRTGGNYWTLPHTYSNTQQLRLLRNMLLREEGDDLLIGYAIPRPWLAEGKRVVVTDAPTQFGPASFRIESGADAVRVHVEPPMRNPMRAMKVRLRHPSYRDIRAVECAPESELSFAGDVVEFPAPRAAIDLLIRY